MTLSSGLVAAIPQIAQQPSSAATILASELPKASTFFLTYFVTTCFAGAAANFLQIAGVVIYTLKLKFLTSTPRSVYTIRCGMSSVQWGTLFPNVTLLAVIAICYSVVSPILNGFALTGFALLWFAYKVSNYSYVFSCALRLLIYLICDNSICSSLSWSFPVQVKPADCSFPRQSNRYD